MCTILVLLLLCLNVFASCFADIPSCIQHQQGSNSQLLVCGSAITTTRTYFPDCKINFFVIQLSDLLFLFFQLSAETSLAISNPTNGKMVFAIGNTISDRQTFSEESWRHLPTTLWNKVGNSVIEQILISEHFSPSTL